ncbi:MAG: DUF3261 domain-containing protein [Nannocystales bacterium]
MTARPHRFTRTAFLLVAAVALGCPPPPPTKTPDPQVGYPGTLRDPGSSPHNFMVRQHAKGSYGERAISFEAVVQKNKDQLIVLVLTPYGSRALLIEQNGAEVRTEKFIDRELPFDPAFILLDVQRVFLKGQPSTPIPADGWTESDIDGEHVRERWAGGRLHERHYTRLDGAPEGTIIVRYEGGFEPGSKPPPIELDNGWFGYSMRLETSDFHPL